MLLSGVHCCVYLGILRQQKQMIAADKEWWEKMWGGGGMVAGRKGKLTFCLANPGSITNTTPSMVRDVSAMFVDTTTCENEKTRVKK